MPSKTSGSILSSDQYAEIEKRGFNIPYLVEVQQASKILLFYGSEHTNNPEHFQFQDIEERWVKFISETKSPIALVEGHFDEVSPDETKDKTTSIINGGEAQFLVHLARRDGVEVVSPEPDRIWEANELAKEFGRDNVVFYYFIRQVGWWNGFTKKPDVQAEATKMLRLMKKSYQWDDVAFSLERMKKIYENLFKKPMEWNATEWIYDITTPATQDYITNELARRSGELRDEHIFYQIKKHWQEDKSLFVVFGSGHAIKLEPALREELR